MNDIFSVIIIVLGLWIATSNIIYLCKLKVYKTWWIDLIAIIGSLWIAILFSTVLFDVFPSGSPPPSLGRPGTILLLTSILCNLLYTRRK